MTKLVLFSTSIFSLSFDVFFMGYIRKEGRSAFGLCSRQAT